MKQTAMQQLLAQLKHERANIPMDIEWDRCYQAIETVIVDIYVPIEKEQIINAYTADCDTLGHINSFKVAAEQYYNETFKSENIVMFMTPENGEIESIILTDNPDCGVKGITFKSE